jgi:branched-subunit amino acid aminotransferase/4-amino-4-deoxychorismate lyase
MSPTPYALLNGRMIPAAELTIPAYDAGFVLGATVSEQLRTFDGALYKLDEHLARLQRGLEITAIELGCPIEQLATWAKELAAANHRLLDPADDLGLSIFVTPGPYATFAPPHVPRQPTIGMSTYPLPFRLWADKYSAGERLAVSDVRQINVASWPRDLKCRSRMHYYLAEQDVRRRSPGARPLLLDEFGHVNETPTANVVGYIGSSDAGYLVAPFERGVLPGISQAELLATAIRLEIADGGGRNFTPVELIREMSELWITSTPFCMLPVVTLDDDLIGNGRPGPVYKKLLDAWSSEVGVDIAAQALRFAGR